MAVDEIRDSTVQAFVEMLPKMSAGAAYRAICRIYFAINGFDDLRDSDYRQQQFEKCVRAHYRCKAALDVFDDLARSALEEHPHATGRAYIFQDAAAFDGLGQLAAALNSSDNATFRLVQAQRLAAQTRFARSKLEEIKTLVIDGYPHSWRAQADSATWRRLESLYGIKPPVKK